MSAIKRCVQMVTNPTSCPKQMPPSFLPSRSISFFPPSSDDFGPLSLSLSLSLLPRTHPFSRRLWTRVHFIKRLIQLNALFTMIVLAQNSRILLTVWSIVCCFSYDVLFSLQTKELPQLDSQFLATIHVFHQLLPFNLKVCLYIINRYMYSAAPIVIDCKYKTPHFIPYVYTLHRMYFLFVKLH